MTYARFDPMDTTNFTRRESLVLRPRHGMPLWRGKLFALLHRDAAPASDFLHIPSKLQVELGALVEV
jgi:KUP system potassium uptake protein